MSVTPDADRARLIAEVRAYLMQHEKGDCGGACYEANLMRRVADLLAAEGWRDSRGFVLPKVVSVVDGRPEHSLQLEGHTRQMDWELELDDDGNVVDFSLTPALPSPPGGGR